MDRKLVVFDIETSGLDSEKHAIIEIGALAISLPEYTELESFHQRIKFDINNANAKALKENSFIHYFEKEGDWKLAAQAWNNDAAYPRAACKNFSNFLKRHATIHKVSKRGFEYSVAQLVGHNSEQFDMPFLKNWYKRLDNMFLPANWFSLDTLQMALTNQQLNDIDYPNLKLETLLQFYGIAETQSHEALSDVYQTATLLPLLHAQK